MDKAIKDQFAQLFVRHYERLTGSKNAIGGLPLTIDTVGCLILFGGREIDMSDITSTVSDRYTMEEFLRDVIDAGIEEDEYFQAAFQEMIDRKYIDPRPDGRIHGYQDAKDTAKLLNRIFPKMQGINLLAYIWQTIGEVTTGRTDLETALSRFDQTLNNHGVMPAKPKIPVIKPDLPKPPPKEEEAKPSRIDSKSSRIFRDYVVSKTPVKSVPSGPKPVEPVAKVEPVQTSLRPPEPQVTEIDEKIKSETELIRQGTAELEKTTVAREATQTKPEAVTPAPQEVPAEAALESREEALPIDDEVDKSVAAFEKELALICPICKTGILLEKTTTAGKIFYSCEAENCNFISWGRPHHIECARCKNPFLVEVTDTAGNTILRCPRATCQHRQPLSAGGGGGVKVVRKRLVRRKK
jgi:hypothetical protein